MKITPEKYRLIKKRWEEKKSNHSSKTIYSASLEQSKFLKNPKSQYFKYVACPLCQGDKYFTFHERTWYSKKRWKSFILAISVKLVGAKITSQIISFVFRKPIIDISKRGYKVVECIDCHFLYRNPIYLENTLEEVYNKSYLSFLSGYYSKKRVNLYKNVLDKLGFENQTSDFSRRRILDIGCGYGLFLNYIRSKGWEPYGFDFAEDCIEYAQKEFKLNNVKVGNIDEDTYTEDYFDAVTMWSVAAHLDDPNNMFNILHKILRPGGQLIILTVNADSLRHMYLLNNWNGFSLNHLIFFTTKTLSTALKKASFSSVAFAYDDTNFNQMSLNGTFPNKHIDYFEEEMRRENLGDMLFVKATNGSNNI